MDNTPRMLFWGIDEFVIMVSPFFIGLLVGSVPVMLSGFFLKGFYRRTKKRYPKGAIRHSLYRNLPHWFFKQSGVFKRLPPSHKRDFLT
ncbi:MAG: type IV conjugative transfer system protein TraL [Chlamydiales bacterium]